MDTYNGTVSKSKNLGKKTHVYQQCSEHIMFHSSRQYSITMRMNKLSIWIKLQDCFIVLCDIINYN